MKISTLIKDIKDIKRLEQLLIVLVDHELGFFISKLKIKHLLPGHMRSRTHGPQTTEPKVIASVFETLGGTFIKLGQILSLRPDLIPDSYCKEFKKLQDNVKPFSGEKAKLIVETELLKTGKKLAYFNKKPIASASISQVHEGVLSNGKKVIIKVQRPDAKEKFDIDIDILYHLAHIAKQHYKIEFVDPIQIVKEFEMYTNNEFDFLKEAENIRKFNKNFKNDKKVIIPELYDDYTTNKILTMEYLHGVNIEKFKDITSPKNKKRAPSAKQIKRRKNLANDVSHSIFKQIFIDGFFHADPHPGNILVLKDDIVGFIDFGIVGTIGETLKEKLINLFVPLMNKNAKGVAEAFIELNAVDEILIDEDKLADDLANLLGEYCDVELGKIDFVGLFHSSVEVARKDNIIIPSNLVLLGKSLLTVEGFCVELNPEFNIIDVCKPFINELVKEEFNLKKITKNTAESLMRMKKFMLGVPDLSKTIVKKIDIADKNIEKIDNNLKQLNYNITRSVDVISLSLLIIGMMIISFLMLDYGTSYLFGISYISLFGFIGAGIFGAILIYKFTFKKNS